MEEIMTPSEVAALLKIHLKTVYKLAEKGVVYIDGRRLVEPYVAPSLRDGQTQEWPRITPGHYFMMGDNRAHSCDSRDWGTVPRENLIGPVFLTYWPLDRIGSP